MNPRRCAQVTTALCGTVGLAGWVVASLTDLGSSGIGNAGAVPIDDSPSPIAEVVDAPQATALGSIAVASADAETVAELVTRSDAGKMVASDQPESIVEAALPDPPQVPPPMQVATANTPDPVLNDTKEAVSTIEIRRGVPGRGHLHRSISCGRSINGRPRRTPSRSLNGGKSPSSGRARW